MLVRSNYYNKRSSSIKLLILQTLDDLRTMKDYYITYLKEPSPENKEHILQLETYVDKNEKKVEKTIQEVISVQQLNKNEIKWFFTMSRMIRELERIGDQMTNIITISKLSDVKELRQIIQQFFNYVEDMMNCLKMGIEEDNSTSLETVIELDHQVNTLNKCTYNEIVTLINQKEPMTESKLKMVVISRFLERIGDHLVNAARIYLKVIR